MTWCHGTDLSPGQRSKGTVKRNVPLVSSSLLRSVGDHDPHTDHGVGEVAANVCLALEGDLQMTQAGKRGTRASTAILVKKGKMGTKP